MEEVDTVVLISLGGVISLGLKHRVEGLVGGEVGAGLADRFELAIELRRPFAVTVSEHALVVIGVDGSHGCRAGSVGSEAGGIGVEGIDLVGDAVVRVGDGLVCDAGVDESHAQRFVAQHGGDCFETHPAVHGLGGERVTELVGMNVPNPGCLGDSVQHAGDLVSVEAAAVPCDEPVEVVITVPLVLVEELNELRVQRDDAVVVKLPDRNAELGPASHVGHCICWEVAEFTNSEPGSDEHLDDETAGWVGIGCGAYEFPGVHVGQKLR